MSSAPPPGISMSDIGSTLLAIAEKARIGLVIGSLDERAVGPVFLNQAAVDLFGHPRDHLMRGANLLDFIAAEERANVDALVRKIMIGDAPGHSFESVIVQADGTRVPVEANFVQIAHGSQILTVNFLVDISVRKDLENKLARIDRLTALGTLAAGVAHEINNPLSFMTLELDALQKVIERSIPDEAAREKALVHLEEIRGGSDRVAKIVRGLRTFSREGEVPRVPLDVWEIVAAADRLVAHRIRERARVRITPTPVPLVLGETFGLEQVFVNLLVNASQAFEGAKDENLVEVTGGVLDDRRVFVDVTDNGSGIPDQLKHRIFDPFFTTKPVGVGTGLGLSICHGILTRFGGDLTVEPPRGAGSTFRVVLEKATAATPETSRREPVRASRRGKVLVIDDEPSIGRSLQAMLEDDHDVDVATSERTGLELLLGETRYDAVLCDLMLGELEGVDVYERLEQQRPELARRLVFMTGGAVTERARTFLAKTTNTCLEKPFDLQALERAIGALIDD